MKNACWNWLRNAYVELFPPKDSFIEWKGGGFIRKGGCVSSSLHGDGKNFPRKEVQMALLVIARMEVNRLFAIRRIGRSSLYHDPEQDCIAIEIHDRIFTVGFDVDPKAARRIIHDGIASILPPDTTSWSD